MTQSGSGGTQSQDSAFLDRSIAMWEQKVRDDPQDLSARVQLANALGFRGRIDDALQHFQRCFRQDPNNGEALLWFGVFLCLQGNLKEGIQTLTRATESDSNGLVYAHATSVLGVAYQMSGERPKAIDCWQSLLRYRSPHFDALFGFEIHLSLGITFLQEGRVDKAIEFLRVAESLAGDKDTIPKRFPQVVLRKSRSSLLSWPKDPNMQEFLDLMIRLSWGLYRPGDGTPQRLVALTLQIMRD